ncbi:MAG: S1-like domain-containing RNA-binding protein [Anaerolineales bacterium]|nr:S1-like domain-containing RNA-binding protein [Anaerolineales bacterium]
MIRQGEIGKLKIIKRATFGLYLGDESGTEVLLPNKFCTDAMKPGQDIDVFIYRDSEGRVVATTQTPKIFIHEFALLQVSSVTAVGAFLNWGLDKDLMVPFREQKQKMEEGRWYIVYMDLDEKTDRLYASNRVERFLQNSDINIKEGEEVSLVVLSKTDLGFSVIINHTNKGLIFENEIFREINIGDILKGYVKKIREDGKIDVSLQPIGFTKFSDSNIELIYSHLIENAGHLNLTDKSSPEEISAALGISKKAFKKAVGSLYKQKKILIQPDGIKLIT